jgi:hypothetical protein
MERPRGVTICATLFFLAAGYVALLGLIMLFAPGTVSMAAGAPLLHGLELAGPYMFLLIGALGTVIGWGLLRLNNWARRAALIVALVGIVMLIPSVSSAAVSLHSPALVWGGLGIAVRAGVTWYLFQTPVAEPFSR